MNREDDFWHSINTLATAYFDGDLRHGTDCACAVGNLVRSANDGRVPAYGCSFTTKQWFASIYSKGYFPDGDPAPNLPYDRDEIILIEAAFEDCEAQRKGVVDWPPREQIDAVGEYDTGDLRLNGLLRVVDALFVIHDVTDEDLRADAKAAFDGEYETVESVL